MELDTIGQVIGVDHRAKAPEEIVRLLPRGESDLPECCCRHESRLGLCADAGNLEFFKLGKILILRGEENLRRDLLPERAELLLECC